MIGILGLIVGLFKGKLETKRAEQQNTVRLLSSPNSHNTAEEVNSLVDKDKWLRRISFFMFAFPFIWAVFDMQGVDNYFSVALAHLPDWYKKTFMAMVGGIWGISSLKNVLPQIIGNTINLIKK